MKIVISGGTEIGQQFANTLTVHNDVKIIESDFKLLKQLEKFDLQVFKGNPTELSILHAAEVEKADAFIACTDSDEVNVISCLAVKQISKAQTFCFVNKDHYFETFAGELGEKLAIDKIIWPEKLLGEQIAKIIAIPGAIDVKVFEHEDLKLLEYKLKSGSFAIGKKLMDLKVPRGVLAVVLFRGDQVIIPRGPTILFKDDKIIFMGHEKPMREIEERFNPAPGKNLEILIIGGGNVGYILAKNLETFKHVHVRLVEKNMAQCRFLTENLSERVLVLNADGTDGNFLKSQQLDMCDCVVAVTGNDERNLMTAMHAKLLNAKKIITRAHSVENTDFFDKLGIDVVVSSQLNAVLNVNKLISDDSIDVFTIFEKGKAEIKEVKVPENFPPTRLMDLRFPDGVVVAAVRRGSHTIVPCGVDKIQADDIIRVFLASANKGLMADFLINVAREAAEKAEQDAEAIKSEEKQKSES